MKRLARTGLFTAVSLLALIVLLLITVQTPFFKDWLKEKAVAAVEPYLAGTIRIGELSGPLFDSIVLSDVIVRDSLDTVIAVDRIELEYTPLAILDNHLLIEKLVLENPAFHIIHRDGRGWNLANLFKTAETGSDSAGPEESPGLAVTVEALTLRDGGLHLQDLSRDANPLPASYAEFELQASGSYSGAAAGLELEALRFRSRGPEEAFTNHPLDRTGMDLEEAAGDNQAGWSSVKGSLSIQDPESPRLELEVTAGPLNLSEVRHYLPDAELYGAPTIQVRAIGPLSDISAGLEITFPAAEIRLEAGMDLAEEPYAYRLTGEIDGLDPARLTGDTSLAGSVNLALALEGSGTAPGEISAKGSIALDSCSVGPWTLKSGELTALARGDSMQAQLKINARAAAVQLDAEVAHHAGTIRSYRIWGSLRDLDFSRLAQGASPTDINATFDLQGSGTTLEEIDASLEAALDSSSIASAPISGSRLLATIRNGRASIDRFRLNSPLLDAEIDGSLGLTDTSSGAITFQARAGDLAQISAFLDGEPITGSLSLSGTVTGTMDSLELGFRYQAENCGMPEYRIGSLSGEAEGSVIRSKISAALSGNASAIEAASVPESAASFHATYVENEATVTVELSSEGEFSVRTEAIIREQPAGILIRLETLEAQTRDQSWSTFVDAATIRLASTAVLVDSFQIQSGGQSLAIGGVFDTADSSDLWVSVRDVDISRAGALLDPQSPYAGILSADLEISGRPESPYIKGSLVVREGGSFGVEFEELAGEFELGGQQLQLGFHVNRTAGDTLFHVGGHLPIVLNLTSGESAVLRDAALKVALRADSLGLGLFEGVSPQFRELTGELSAAVTLRHTLNDLKGGGRVRLRNGGFEIPELGVAYRDIELDLLLSEREVQVKQFSLVSGDGRLQIIEGSLALSQQQIEEFLVRLEATNFQLMDNQRLQASAKGEIQLSGSVQKLEFGGRIEIPEARVYYPAWIVEETAVELTERPFFVISDDSVLFDSSGALGFQDPEFELEKPFLESEYYKNISGNLTVILDRNTWLRGEEASVEVEGELSLQKSGAEFVLFGTLSVVRGFYQLQGRRFDIREGELTFVGDSEIDPGLYLVAAYQFVDGSTGEQREIVVTITGDRAAPAFEFTLDGQPVEQTNVLSLLLFGKTVDQLGVSERDDLSEETSLEERAAGILTGQLLSALGSQVNQQLNLDVLQIESGEGLGDTKISVGKYITPDVFVSVSQDFGEEGDQEVQLEYKLPPEIVVLNLFLQATRASEGETGVDLIWKYEW